MKIDLPLLYQGKVRDIYDLGKTLLICATDRVSAFDHILPTVIPNKGKVLHKLSMFWFDFLKDETANHLITGDFEKFPKELKKFEYLRDRAMIVKKAKRINVEAIARGYLAGSGWKEYQKSQTICGIELPKGLLESSKLPSPIFTPSSKADGGDHDENISFEQMGDYGVGSLTAQKIKDSTINLYKKVADFALTKGIIVADTKLEFGFYESFIILIDEVFTPDSSRFWEADKYVEGKAQESLDKQFIRDYLEKIKWDKRAPAPELPAEVVQKTMEKYVLAYEKLTGKKFDV
jgi:phosphoribosylaminoimidazole-succinocarboxamide synthase